jgi:hypothetical protein
LLLLLLLMLLLLSLLLLRLLLLLTWLLLCTAVAAAALHLVSGAAQAAAPPPLACLAASALLLCAGDWCAQHFLKKLLRHKALLHLLLPAAANAQRCSGAPALKLPAWHRGEKRHHLASKDGELARLFARKVKEHARKAGRPL